MGFFNSQQRTKLKQAKATLEEWCQRHSRGELSHLVTRFQGLIAEVDDVLGAFSIDEFAANNLLGRIARMESSLNDLQAFKQALGQGQQELKLLEANVATMEVVAGQLRPPIQALQAGLESLTVAFSSPAQLDGCQQRLQQIVGTARLLNQAAELAHRADKVNKKAEGLEHPSALGLRAEFPIKLGELSAMGEGCDATLQAWINDLSQRVQEVELEVRDVPEHQPNTLIKASKDFARCQGWSEVLGRHPDDLRELKDRVGLSERGWRKLHYQPGKIESLAATVATKLEALASDARQQRDSMLASLENQLDIFERVCRQRANVQQDLDKLRQRHERISSPPGHEKWIAQYEETLQKFRGDATAMQFDLERRKASEIELRRQQLIQVEQVPLSDQVSRELETLRQELNKLEEVQDIEALLRSLLQVGHIGEMLESLESRALEEKRSLDSMQSDLEVRYATLVKLAQAVDLQAWNLTQEMGALAQPGQGRTLNQVQHLTSETAQRLTEAEQSFIGQCIHQHGQLLAELERGADLLDRMNFSGAPEAEVTEIDSSGPKQAAEHLRYIRSVRQALEVSLGEAEQTLAGRLEACTCALQQVPAAQLQRDQNADLEDLLEVLTSRSWQDAQQPIARLEMMQSIEEEYSFFQEQLQRDRVETDEIASRIRRRLEDAARQGLNNHAHELFERINLLLHGIPENPISWAPVRAQLELCEAQLKQVMPHCQRLAAEEVRVSLKRLRAMMPRREKDTAWRAKAQDLERKLGTPEAPQLPEKFLRRRLKRLAPAPRRS